MIERLKTAAVLALELSAILVLIAIQKGWLTL